MKKQIEGEMKQLAEWDEMSESEQAEVTTFVTGSCGVHAVCNISVAMNKELARCEYMLAPLSDAQRQEITLGSLDDLLSQPATDDNVTLSGSSDVAANDASAHLITRCSYVSMMI